MKLKFGKGSSLSDTQTELRTLDPEGYDVLSNLLVSASEDRIGSAEYLDAYASVDLEDFDQVAPMIKRDSEAWQYPANFPIDPSLLDIRTFKGQYYSTMARILEWAHKNKDLDFVREFYGHWLPFFCVAAGTYEWLSDEEINQRTRQYLGAVYYVVFGKPLV
ncbi:MAG: hypothetical protein B7X53_08760 [Hyphomonas sp. 34-62-18]|nr:hypothetical protein [Hyphomonas sp. 34-62-18]OZB16484.1 MAG: hypothetical protein B7X53_08760 [Hyphomonas sp. 34-62-18]